ncbi:hypothetical protein [Rhizobium sp. BK176]|uniref:hypothetical protein n=1 Tax=Rhizobium sp. BK176 TaxID=2587071 RepID=UPI002167A2B4|nr:hypothetical protein [Rhizobium sp. BK176]MCS4089201.1 hypothetical protein [Rhizobium sp. BK176]
MKKITDILVGAWRPFSNALMMLALLYIVVPDLFSIELPDPSTKQIVVAVVVFIVWTIANGVIDSALRHFFGSKAS